MPTAEDMACCVKRIARNSGQIGTCAETTHQAFPLFPHPVFISTAVLETLTGVVVRSSVPIRLVDLHSIPRRLPWDGPLIAGLSIQEVVVLPL